MITRVLAYARARACVFVSRLAGMASQVRSLGVPGGGGLATAADLALLLQPLLPQQRGRLHDGSSLLSEETLALATATQHTDERHSRYRDNMCFGGLVLTLNGVSPHLPRS